MSPPPRILLVEDEAIIALSERKTLERHGFSAETVPTGERAVEAVASGAHYDLVLMDIDLGDGMDGTEAAERILEQRDIPIVFLTGHAEKEYVERVRSITSYGYVLKNSGEFVLAESVRMALELFRAHRELAEKEQHYELALYGGELGTWDWDVTTDRVTFNRYWAEMKGYSPGEIKPHYSSWEDRVHPDDLPPTLEALHAHLEGETDIYEAQFRMQRKSGEWMWIQDRGKVLQRDREGRPLRVCGTHRDITEAKRAHTALEETTAELRRYARDLECLHEIGDVVSTAGLDLDALLQRIVDQIAESLSHFSGMSARIVLDHRDFTTEEFTAATYTRSIPISVHGAQRGSLEIAWTAGEDEEHSGFFSDQQTLLETIGERLGRIIERYEAEERLREREEFLRITLASIGDAVVATDLGGRVTLANQTAEKLTGLSFEEVRNERTSELVELFDSRSGEPLPHPVQTVLETDTALQLSNHSRLRVRNGREFQVADSASPIKDDKNRTRGVVLVFRDETDRYAQQERLRRSEEFNRTLVETSPVGITRVNRDGIVDFANRKAEEILGLTRDHIGERTYNDPAWRITNIDGTSYAHDVLPFALVKNSGRPVYGIEHAIEWPGGERKLLSISGSPLFDDYGEFDGMVSAIEDITDSRRVGHAEKQLAERVEAGLRAGNLAWWEMQLPSGNVIFDEHKAHMLGYSPQQFATYHDFIALLHPDDREKAMQAMRAHLDGTAATYEVEYRITTHDGTYKWFRDVGGITERKEQSGTIRVIGIVEDITERKRLEAELRAAVSDKARLVREMNHRVKNNLNMVLSLLTLKEDALGGAADLSDIRSQISAISFIHERLHQSEDATHIDFRRYIDDLLPRLFSFYGGSSVCIQTYIEEIFLPSGDAATLGLIVNELATNAMQHGFTEEKTPVFTVRLTPAEPGGTTYTLTVSNSGRPFPKDVSLEQADTLGLQLITALVDQLGGSIDLEREPHPVFTIRF